MKFVSLNKLTRAMVAIYTKIEKVFATKKELENGLDTKADAGHVHADATTITNGFMSKDDKSKLDGISTGAQKNSDITKAEIENKLTGTIGSHNHNNIVTRGQVTAEKGTNRPSVNGLSMSEVYNNGYPTTYGNVINLKGQGDGQILVGWSANSGNHAPVYIRSKRDVPDANWSNWAELYTTANKPELSELTQSSNYRFVTDTEKANWNAKASTAVVTTTSNGLMSKDDKSKLDGISSGAQKNSDITKAEIENKLTGTITSHNHNYLPLNGGTINGNLTLNQGFKVHNAEGTYGTNGLVKVAEIKITSNYQNQPIYFLISQRGKQMSTLEIQFINTNNNDPSLQRFYRTGEIEAYMHKTGTGIWDLYISKSESYDCIDILDFRKGSYMNGLTVTWTNIQASSVPSGAIATTIRPDENIGSLSSLNTSNKTNVVNAINEVNNKLGNGLSQLSDLYNDTINYL